MFIIAGSTITPATSPGCVANARSRASRSLKPTTVVSSTVDGRDTTRHRHRVRRIRRSPIRSTGGSTETSTESWCPWYEASILMIRSRSVKPRARRIASSVDSVPLLVNRHCGCWNRRASSRGDGDVLGHRLREVGASMHLRFNGGDDRRMRMADNHDAEPVVEIDVLVAVDVPDTAALAVVDEDRLRWRVLERAGHAARDVLLGSFQSSVTARARHGTRLSSRAVSDATRSESTSTKLDPSTRSLQ